MKTSIFFTLCIALLGVGGLHAREAPTDIPGYPDSVEGYDPREVALLPSYCKHTQLFRKQVPGGNDPKEIKRWSMVLGPTFSALHHYCWGLMKTNRALFLARNAQAKTFYLESSIREFDYVLRQATLDFPLLPEILHKKGENLIRLNDGPAGVKELERAIAVKPDYWPPYAALSDYYREVGDLLKAREVLEKALSYDPHAKPLQSRLAQLAGRKRR